MKTLREKALEQAVEAVLQRHERFGHQAGQHEGSTTCWFTETELRLALLIPEAKIDVPGLVSIYAYFEERADVKDSKDGGVVESEEQRHLETMKNLLELRR